MKHERHILDCMGCGHQMVVDLKVAGVLRSHIAVQVICPECGKRKSFGTDMKPTKNGKNNPSIH